jgi:hypothetical protein
MPASASGLTRTLRLMTNRLWIGVAFIALACAAMSALRFGDALRQAGPYSDRTDVQIVITLGLLFSHAAAAGTGAFVASLLRQVK